jgi:hypothetical protein
MPPPTSRQTDRWRSLPESGTATSFYRFSRVLSSVEPLTRLLGSFNRPILVKVCSRVGPFASGRTRLKGGIYGVDDDVERRKADKSDCLPACLETVSRLPGIILSRRAAPDACPGSS